MSDGSIAIDVLVDDKAALKSITQLESASNNFGNELKRFNDSKLQNVVSLSQEASSGFKNVEDSTSNFSDELKKIDDSNLKDVVNTSQRASSGFKDIVTSLGLVKIASAAFNVLKNSLDSAIARFDTMNQFPNVLEKMGFSAEQSQRSIRKLTDGIQGLPTTLDGIASVTQRIASITGDLALASDTALALNNALLASGASAEQASSGIEQYVQMLSTGQVDLESWKILETNMKYALDETARSFLGATANSRGLYEALQSGTITFDQFGNKLIELSTATGGFADTALESSKGLMTSMQNIGTAVVSGLERIIRKVNNLVENVTGKEIYEHLDSFKNSVSTAFLTMGRAIDTMTPIVKVGATVLGNLFNVAKELDFAIIGLAASFSAYKVIATVSNNLARLRVAFSILTVVKTNATLATKLYTLEQIKAATSSKIAATAVALLTGKVSLMTLATTAASKALTFLSGPAGWAVAAIGALAGAGFLAYQRFTKLSPEVLKLAEDSKDAAEASEQLRDSIKDSADSFTNRMSDIDGQTESLRKLADQTVNLSRKENLSAADKKILKANIEDLNGSVSGLALAFDEETKSLNMSAEAMETRINLMDQEQRFNAARERGVEIEKEKADILLQQQVNAELLARTQKEIEETNFLNQNSKTFDEIKRLEEENIRLGESYEELGEVAEITAQIQAESAEAAAEAQRQAIDLGISKISDLEGAQRELAESAQSSYQAYADSATNAFEKIDQTAKASINEMIANSAHNKEAMLQMANDAAELRTRFDELGLDQTIIDQFIAMGTEGPGLVSELATATDEQLATLVSNTDAKSTDLKDAFMKMFDIDEEDFVTGFGDIVTTMEDTLSKRLAESDLRESVREAITGDGEVTAALGQEVGQKIAEGLGGAGAEFETAGGTLAESTATGFTNNQSVVVEAAQGMMTEVEQATADGSENMQTTMESGMDTLKSIVESGFNAVLDVIRTTLGQSVTIAQSTSKGIVSALRSAVGGATQAGRDTGAGFRNGIESQRGSIMATATSIADAAASAMRRALDIKSPSGVTTKIGEFTGQGLVVGMENSFDKVQHTAKKLATLASPNLTYSAQSLGLGEFSHGLNESFLPKINTNDLFQLSGTQPFNSIQNSTNKVTQVTQVDNKETNALLKLIAEKDVQVSIDGQLLSERIAPYISRILGENVTDIERGW